MLSPEILQWCSETRAWLEALLPWPYGPMIPWVILSMLCCVVYVPRLFPKVWERIPRNHLFDTLPASVIGAAWATITTGDGDPWLAVRGVLAGAFVPILIHYHSKLKAGLDFLKKFLPPKS